MVLSRVRFQEVKIVVVEVVQVTVPAASIRAI